MSNIEELENYESIIEDKSQEIEEKNQKYEEANQRLNQIETTIGNLREDQEVASTLESNKEHAEQERENIEEQLENLRGDLEQLQEEFEAMNEQNEESYNELTALSYIGENVKDGIEIIESRRSQISNNINKIQQLLSDLKY